MALVSFGLSRCSLCGEVIEVEDTILGFPHFLDEKHKFGRYSDSVMHRHCFETWNKRDAFRKEFDKAFPGSDHPASKGNIE